MSRLPKAIITATLVLLVLPAETNGRQVMRVIAVSGEPVPGGDGEFYSFESPFLNDIGQLSFTAVIDVDPSEAISLEDGVFFWDGISLNLVVRDGDPVPGSVGAFGVGPIPVPINNLGQITFHALDDSSGPGLFRSSDGAMEVLAYDGQPSPDGNGRIGQLFGYVGYSVDSEHVVLGIVFTDTSGGADDDEGIYRTDGNSLIRIARAPDAMPEGDGTFWKFGDPHSNSNNHIACRAWLQNTAAYPLDNQVAFRSSIDTGEFAVLLQENDDSPDGNGRIDMIDWIVLDNLGTVTAKVDFRNTAGGDSDDEAVVLTDGLETKIIAREGSMVPDDNGVFPQLFYSSFTTSSSGDTLVVTEIEESRNGYLDDTGIFLWNGSELETIVREGDLAPGGEGTIGHLHPHGSHAINDVGSFVFQAYVHGQDYAAIFMNRQNDGLFEFWRRGTQVLGSPEISMGWFIYGLNNREQLAVRFVLDDGRRGIALISRPGSCSASDVSSVSLGQVDHWDLLEVLFNWGACDAICQPCSADTDGDCQIGVSDLLNVLKNWGPCE